MKKIKLSVLIILIITFGLIILVGFNQTKTVSSESAESYKYISEVITDSQSTFKIVVNKNITEYEMKKIYDEYSEKKEGCKVWFYKTEEDTKTLSEYNIAEIKKENGEYKIHKYGEETEEEKTARIEAEQIAKEEEEKKKEAEEKAKKEQEEIDFKASCNTYAFKEIARNPETFKGTKVKLTGEVIQVIYGTYTTEMRVNITKQGSYSTYYTDTIYVIYYPEDGEGKILEDDIITLWGISQGDYTYTSTLGIPVNLPFILAEYIEIN